MGPETVGFTFYYYSEATNTFFKSLIAAANLSSSASFLVVRISSNKSVALESNQAWNSSSKRVISTTGMDHLGIHVLSVKNDNLFLYT